MTHVMKANATAGLDLAKYALTGNDTPTNS